MLIARLKRFLMIKGKRMEKTHRPAEAKAEARVAVPLNVQVEIAKQNQKLAEFRYTNLVRRGRAWNVAKKVTGHRNIRWA
jgi:hypothetical protein